MKKFFEEFKAFAMRGNVLDMAVGVVIGGAFGKITNSVVNDIIMPLISMLTGGIDFSAWKWVLKEAVMEGAKVVTPEVAVNYGNLTHTGVVLEITLHLIFFISLRERTLCGNLPHLIDLVIVVNCHFSYNHCTLQNLICRGEPLSPTGAHGAPLQTIHCFCQIKILS